MASAQFPNLWQAMHVAAVLVQQQWQTVAERALRTPGERDAYISGLQGPDSVSISETGSSMQVTLRNTHPTASRIEEGFATYHLPERIDWKGRAYIIVPFRHYSAQRGSRAALSSPTARRLALPRPLYTLASRLQPGQYLTAGPTHGRAVHAPGLTPYVPAFPRNVRPGYTHVSQYERLQRVGRGSQTRFLTFRTITPTSPGWWIPGKSGQHLAARTVREVTPQVQQLLTDAARADLVTLISSTMSTGGQA
jgi:hypothetical protein